MATSKFVGIILGTYRLLDNLKREAVAAIVDLGHHRWLRLKALNGKPADNVTRPSLEFKCQAGAQAVSVNVLNRLAY